MFRKMLWLIRNYVPSISISYFLFRIEYDPGLCNAIDDEEEPSDGDYQNYQDNNANDDERVRISNYFRIIVIN